MVRRRPPHPWRQLPCAAHDLFEFTGGLLRGDVDAVIGTLASPASVVDLLVGRHRLGPLLSTRAADASWMGKLPPATLARIGATYERQKMVSDRCLELLNAIDVECAKDALPFLVVKGPAMALRCYGGIAARGYWDLDIMVAEGDRMRMETLLGRIGAFRLSRAVVGTNLSARFNHAFDYEVDGVKLDLHWCMSRLPGVRCDGAAVFDRAESLELAGRAVRILSPADELHFVLISAFADIQRGFLRLQTFVDAWELLLRIPRSEWKAFFMTRTRERTERICRETLRVILASLRVEDAVPELVDALDGCPTTEEARRVMLPSPAGIRGKRWAAGVLPVGFPRYAAWWCVSLPFRVAASHPAWRRRR
ncbi:MAG: nucleotidyltransferase family protein [Planctomycetia bacterium]